MPGDESCEAFWCHCTLNISATARKRERPSRDAGPIYRKSGAKVPVSAIHTILHARLYTGWYEWNGKMIQGQHQPLVSVEL